MLVWGWLGRGIGFASVLFGVDSWWFRKASGDARGVEADAGHAVQRQRPQWQQQQLQSQLATTTALTTALMQACVDELFCVFVHEFVRCWYWSLADTRCYITSTSWACTTLVGWLAGWLVGWLICWLLCRIISTASLDVGLLCSITLAFGLASILTWACLGLVRFS